MTLRIGLIGCGTVGSSLVRLLQEERDAIALRVGEPLEVTRIAVARIGRVRDAWIPSDLLVTDWRSAVEPEDIDLVVEVVGDQHEAHEAITRALYLGKSVVTANKAILARNLRELERLAQGSGCDLFFEAAVAGAVPLIRTLRVSLAGERINAVMGVVNGTTNFILTRMDEDGLAFGEALTLAQQRGFAEADSGADLSGRDAASKVAIIASLAFGQYVSVEDVRVAGIEGVTLEDIAFARRSGYVVKLVARAVHYLGELEVSVEPTFVPRSHPLAGVRDAYNAVFVEGEWAGDLMLYGPGAGGAPTAAAVLGDLIDAARNRLAGVSETFLVGVPAHLRSTQHSAGRFYLSMDVEDAPGVLSSVSRVFGGLGISIASMEQVGSGGGIARLAFVTHVTTVAAMDMVREALSCVVQVKELGRTFRLHEQGK